MRLQRGLYNVDVKNVAFIIMALTTSDEFTVSNYFGDKSDTIITLDKPLPSTQIFPQPPYTLVSGRSSPEWGLFQELVLEAVVLTNKKITFYT